MQMTLAIDNDVATAATEIAKKENRTVDEVISELARRSLETSRQWEKRNGIPLLPERPDGKPVTLDVVNALRDEDL